MAFHGHYGYFRDELYYIACSRHLAWGYVDQPPLSIGFLALTRSLFGDSLYAIRFSAALAGAVLVVLVGLTARKLGGGRAAQAIAALAAALSPVILGNAGRTFSMNAFDLLLWGWAAYLVVVILQEDRPRLWPLFGLVAGLGLLNKYSMGFFGLGLVVGLVATRARREFFRPWIWIGGAVALALFLPHLAWESAHGWPSIEFMRAASQEKNVALPVGEFFVRQLLETGLGGWPLWLAGLGWFVFHPSARRLRVFAWLYPVVFAVMATQGAKPYYLTPIYAPYLAAGAVWLEGLTARGRRTLLRPVYATVLAALSLISLPFAIPCLPVDTFIRYSQALGQTPKADERSAVEDLPQYYADQFGWQEFVARVAGIYDGLPPEERDRTVVYVRNYGEAAALDFFGPRYGLPPALCAHNSYWFWGPGKTDMRVAIILGDSRDLDQNLSDLEGPGRCGKAELAGVTECRHCMPYERGRQLFVCREPQFTFQEIWAGEKVFI